jgi:hypothetical protein
MNRYPRHNYWFFIDAARFLGFSPTTTITTTTTTTTTTWLGIVFTPPNLSVSDFDQENSTPYFHQQMTIAMQAA